MSCRKEKPIEKRTAYFDATGVFHPRIVSSDPRKAVELPALSHELVDLLTRFAGCQLECCGFATVTLTPSVESDKRWKFQHSTMQAIQLEIEKARGIQSTVLWIPELRYILYKDDWLMLLEFLVENLEKSKQWQWKWYSQ